MPPLPPQPVSAPEERQRARVARVESQVEAHELHASPERDEVLAAAEREAKLEGEEARLRRRAGREAAAAKRERSASSAGAAGSSEEGGGGSAGFLEGGAIAGLLESLGRGGVGREVAPASEGGDALSQFRSIGELLRCYGALDGDSADGWEATEFGALVASLSGENELWLALVLMEAAAAELEPPQLAAVLAATLDERLRPNTFVRFAPSEAVYETVDVLADRAAELQRAQMAAGLSFPVGLDAGLCGLVEAWAAGEGWESLVAGTSLDLGDLFRLLRRSLELLKTVSAVPYVSEAAKAAARAAVRACDRYPIAEDELMALPEEEPGGGEEPGEARGGA